MGRPGGGDVGAMAGLAIEGLAIAEFATAGFAMDAVLATATFSSAAPMEVRLVRAMMQAAAGLHVRIRLCRFIPVLPVGVVPETIPLESPSPLYRRRRRGIYDMPERFSSFPEHAWAVPDRREPSAYFILTQRETGSFMEIWEVTV